MEHQDDLNTHDDDVDFIDVQLRYRREKVAGKPDGALGVGATGTVWKVLDTRQSTTRHPIWRAVKILHPERAASERVRKNFRREALLAQDLRHDNIVAVFDVLDDAQNRPTIVMEYLQGRTLREVLRERCEQGVGAYSLDEALSLLGKVARALDYIHKRKLVHRDVKPENIFISEKDQSVKLLDFGLAALHEDADLSFTQEWARGGTWGYMPPDTDSAAISHKVDVYALAVILYELLESRHSQPVASLTGQGCVRLAALNDAQWQVWCKACNLGFDEASGFLQAIQAAASEIATPIAEAPPAPAHPQTPPSQDRIKRLLENYASQRKDNYFEKPVGWNCRETLEKLDELGYPPAECRALALQLDDAMRVHAEAEAAWQALQPWLNVAPAQEGEALVRLNAYAGKYALHDDVVQAAIIRIQHQQGQREDEAAWRRADRSRTPDAFRAYLQAFPQGLHFADANRALAQFADEADWSAALAADTEEAYATYLGRQPEGRHRGEAETALGGIRVDKNLWQVACSEDTIPAYEKYLAHGWVKKFEAKARLAIEKCRFRDDEQLWAQAERLNTAAAYERYLSLAPLKTHAKTAQERIGSLRDTHAFERAKHEDTLTAWWKYLQEFPRGSGVEQARERVRYLRDHEQEEALWAKTCKADSRRAYRNYLKKSKLRHYAEAAQAKLGDMPGDVPGLPWREIGFGLAATVITVGGVLYSNANRSEPPAEPAVVMESAPAAPDVLLADRNQPLAERLAAYRALSGEMQKTFLEAYQQQRARFRATEWWQAEGNAAVPAGAQDWLADAALLSEAGHFLATIDWAWANLYGKGGALDTGRSAELYRKALKMPEAAKLPPEGLNTLKELLADAEAASSVKTRLPAAGSGESFRDRFKDGSGSGPELVVIPAGRFQMGSPKNEKDRDGDEGPQHAVTIGRSFALGKYEVTQGEWRAVMGSTPPELFFKDCGERCPVEKVNWNDVQVFIKKLSEKTGQQYRLPSESEWEYACRAGGTEKYCGSNDAKAVAWYGDNNGSKAHPVGQKAKNAWGLYDMSGNVWEWVEDCYIDNYRDGPKDEKARGNHDDRQCRRVLRGGSWYGDPWSLRSAVRYDFTPSDRVNIVGFRLARTLP